MVTPTGGLQKLQHQAGPAANHLTHQDPDQLPSNEK